MIVDNLTIIIPVLNEEKYLDKLFTVIDKYPNNLEYIFCDGGSTDKSLEMLNSYCLEKHHKVIHNDLANPSVMGTLSLSRDLISTNYCMIHPVDANCIEILGHVLNNSIFDFDYMISYKRYSPGNILLSIQEFFLNLIRVKLLKNYVWTNCPILKTKIFKEILIYNDGFLEDILSSDYLKANYSLNTSTIPVNISNRRYRKDGHIKRILSNVYILFLFRLRLKDIGELKKMYYKN